MSCSTAKLSLSLFEQPNVGEPELGGALALPMNTLEPDRISKCSEKLSVLRETLTRPCAVNVPRRGPRALPDASNVPDIE